MVESRLRPAIAPCGSSWVNAGASQPPSPRAARLAPAPRREDLSSTRRRDKPNRLLGSGSLGARPIPPRDGSTVGKSASSAARNAGIGSSGGMARTFRPQLQAGQDQQGRFAKSPRGLGRHSGHPDDHDLATASYSQTQPQFEANLHDSTPYSAPRIESSGMLTASYRACRRTAKSITPFAGIQQE